jgi:hypothetical protein
MVVTRVALEKEDIIELESILDDRYVLQSECGDKQAEVNKKFARDDKRIEIISHDFRIIKWLVSTVAASSIAALVVAIMELILK